MKFLKLADEVLFNTELTSNEKIVYAVLLRLYNTEKECSYPSMDYIVKITGISISTVKRSIKNLVKLGYCEINKKQSVNSNFNTYTNLKYLVLGKEENKVPTSPEGHPIVSDMKESGVQLPIPSIEESEVPEISEYTVQHQQKISIVLKQNIVLSDKQKDIIGDMDLEILRESIRAFKKKRGRTFTFLMQLYLDVAARKGTEVSRDIQKYTGCLILTEAEKETQAALKELYENGPYGLCI